MAVERERHVSSLTYGDHVCLLYEDPAEQMAAVVPFLVVVFDRFRQGDRSITRAHGGLGLGLAIVRHLVELHGGFVTAASSGEGQGATFTVRLPIPAVLIPCKL